LERLQGDFVVYIQEACRFPQHQAVAHCSQLRYRSAAVGAKIAPDLGQTTTSLGYAGVLVSTARGLC
jgi:hypothetical protein